MSDQIRPGKTPRLRSIHKTPRFAAFRSISALMLREMTTAYGRTPGGYVWVILEPALAIALMVALFSSGFRSPALGTNFAIYYASGILPYYMFLTTSSKISQAVNYSRMLLNYPRVTFIDAIIARFLLNILTQGLVSYILFSTILLVFETRTILDVGRLLHVYVMAAAVGLGVGLLNCVLFSRHQLWQTIWGVLTRPLLLLSGVVFLHDRIPDPYGTWLEWNPLVHIMGEARKAFYFSYRGEYVDISYVYLFSVITSCAGLLFLMRYYRDLLER